MDRSDLIRQQRNERVGITHMREAQDSESDESEQEQAV
jgi:hypothetical protein